MPFRDDGGPAYRRGRDNSDRRESPHYGSDRLSEGRESGSGSQGEEYVHGNSPYKGRDDSVERSMPYEADDSKHDSPYRDERHQYNSEKPGRRSPSPIIKKETFDCSPLYGDKSNDGPAAPCAIKEEPVDSYERIESKPSEPLPPIKSEPPEKEFKMEYDGEPIKIKKEEVKTEVKMESSSSARGKLCFLFFKNRSIFIVLYFFFKKK